MKTNSAVSRVFDLKAGELFFGVGGVGGAEETGGAGSDNDMVISTVLGPCVAVTMFNRRLGVWAIAHAMSPEYSEQEARTEGDMRFKFVDSSIEYMSDMFEGIGVRPDEIEVMLFGGSSVLGERYGVEIGSRNVARACSLIADRGLTLVFSDVGGKVVRSILFYASLGRAVLKSFEAGMGRREKEKCGSSVLYLTK